MNVKFGRKQGEGRPRWWQSALRALAVLGFLVILLSLPFLAPGQARADTKGYGNYGQLPSGAWVWLSYNINLTAEPVGSCTFSLTPSQGVNGYDYPQWAGPVVITCVPAAGYKFLAWDSMGTTPYWSSDWLNGMTFTATNKTDLGTQYLNYSNGRYAIGAKCIPNTVSIETRPTTGFIWDSPSSSPTTVAYGATLPIHVEIASAYSTLYEFAGWLTDSSTTYAQINDKTSMNTYITVGNAFLALDQSLNIWVQPTMKLKAAAASDLTIESTPSEDTVVWAWDDNSTPWAGNNTPSMTQTVTCGDLTAVFTDNITPGYVFTGWSCTDCTVTDATKVNTTVRATAAGASTLEANWEVQTNQIYGLTIDTIGSGTTSPPVGTYSYIFGTPMTAQAYPGTGYAFDHWNFSCSGSPSYNNPLIYVVTENCTMTAVFTASAPPPSGGGLTTTGLWGGLSNILGDVGLNNDMGRLLVIAGAMMLAFVVVRKSNSMRVIAPLGILGVGIIGGWVPIWLVVLLGIGVAAWLVKASGNVARGGS